MYYFSQKSKDKLSTVHEDLQKLFNEVIQHFDCTITSGLRTLEEQQALYAQGRTKPGAIVTNVDGELNKSNHQSGNAVDVVPYPEMWSDEDKLREFGGFVLGVAAMLNIEIEWGGRWKQIVDMPHYQIRK